jgi:uracil-DNA glycosylase
MSSSVAIITLESYIPDNWRRIFAKIVTMREWHDLEKTYAEFEIAGQTIFPAKHAIFHAFQLVDPHDVRVVIIGQDPYH